jgi:hypothetical protein
VYDLGIPCGILILPVHGRYLGVWYLVLPLCEYHDTADMCMNILHNCLYVVSCMWTS